MKKITKLGIPIVILLLIISLFKLALAVTVWQFSDGTVSKTITFTSAPGADSSAKITIPLKSTITAVSMTLEQKLVTTQYIWVPLSAINKVAQMRVSDGAVVKIWDAGPNPSRLAVSPDGKTVWVANRNDATVTKIDTTLGTSTNYNVPQAGPRGVTFDHNGNVWVADGSVVVELNPNTGAQIRTLTAADGYNSSLGYGADTDPQGYVWIVGRGGGHMFRINPETYAVDDIGYIGPELYGIGIDSTGDVWLGSGWDHKVYKIAGSSKPNFKTVLVDKTFPSTNADPVALTRGVAIDSNDNVWVAINTSGDWPNGLDKLYELDKNGNLIRTVDVGRGVVGVSVSVEENPAGVFTEYIWAVNYGSSSVMKIKQATGQVIGSYCADGNNAPPSPPTFISGKYGKALQFSGSNHVTVADSASLDITGAITMEAWINIPDFRFHQALITKGSDGTAWGYLMQFYPGAPPYDQMGFYTDNTNWSSGASGKIPLNTWTHVAVTYDGSSKKFYTNGVLDANIPATGAILATTSPLRIGKRSDGYNFVGGIDDVRIYNRALSQTEIQNDRAQNFINNSGLVGYWNFDEGSGLAANDGSGNNNNGTLEVLSLLCIDATTPYNYSNMTGFRGPLTTLDIGNNGTVEWSGASYITSAVLDSNLAAAELTNLSQTCTCPGCSLAGNQCTIDFTFKTSTTGTIKLSGFNVIVPNLEGFLPPAPPPGMEMVIDNKPADLSAFSLFLIKYLLSFIIVLGFFTIVSGGIIYAAGAALQNAKFTEMGASMVKYTIIGLAIAGISFVIIQTIVGAILR